MRFEVGKVGWSSTVQIHKTKNFQYKEYKGFPMSYTCCANETGTINKYSPCFLRI